MLIYIQRKMRFGPYTNVMNFCHFVADLNRNQVGFHFNIWHFTVIISIIYLLLDKAWIFSTSSKLNLFARQLKYSDNRHVYIFYLRFIECLFVPNFRRLAAMGF